ncbi:MAG TPA: hypothetical protein VHR45_21805 [Thermoanaerobaculia bacterium]|nr:hypothetical protein [Thermoanaerobaculia bacterium]
MAGDPSQPSADWTRLLIRNTLLWIAPVALVWYLLTPLYNRMLLRTAQSLLHLGEHPVVTDLYPKDNHDAYIARRDLPKRLLPGGAFRVTDLHFHFLLLGALFLGVPAVSWRDRLGNLGWAALATACFDVLLVVAYVEFFYATQMGSWSTAHYGAFARNFYGLGKHLLDLPFKLALPLVLWAAFYLPRMLAEVRPAAHPPATR